MTKFCVEQLISLKTEDYPTPVSLFAEAFGPECCAGGEAAVAVSAALTATEFSSPTAIQSAAWPVLLSGMDFVGIARCAAIPPASDFDVDPSIGLT